MEFKTLLVPLDGSTLAEAAVPYAEALARATGASLRLLAVVQQHTDEVPEPYAKLALQSEQMQHKHLEQYLAHWRESLQARGLAVRAAVIQGHPVDEILAAAQEQGLGMTVMATAGRGGFERWAVGSVADKIMRLSRKPLLLVRPHDDHVGHHPVAIRRLLVPLDGSPFAEAALPIAAELAAQCGAKLVLVRVEPWIPLTALGPNHVRNEAEIEASIEAGAAAYLHRSRASIPSTLLVETHVLRGVVLDSLLGIIVREQVDLVVMTTHGRGGLRRLVLGSTADRFVRGGVPTLLISATNVRCI